MQSLLIITNVVSSNLAHVEVSSIQLYAIKFISDLRQIGDCLRVVRFLSPIILTTMI